MDKGLTERVELPGELVEAVGPYLARQRWYAGEGPPLSMQRGRGRRAGRAEGRPQPAAVGRGRG